MKNLIIMILSFLIFSNFLLWNLGKRTLEFTERVTVSEELSFDEAIYLVDEKNDAFFLTEGGVLDKSGKYEHYTEVKILKTKSIIPMFYTNKTAVSSKSFLMKRMSSTN